MQTVVVFGFPYKPDYSSKYAWATAIFSLMPWCPLAKAAGQCGPAWLAVGGRGCVGGHAGPAGCLRRARVSLSSRLPSCPLRHPGSSPLLRAEDLGAASEDESSWGISWANRKE